MNEKCTIYRVADFFGKKWTILILLEIYKGRYNKRRYSELKNIIPGITPKILSKRLKEMKHQGIIKNKIIAKEFPIISEYSLTKSGKEIIKVIRELKVWALKNQFRNKHCEINECGECNF